MFHTSFMFWAGVTSSPGGIVDQSIPVGAVSSVSGLRYGAALKGSVVIRSYLLWQLNADIAFLSLALAFIAEIIIALPPRMLLAYVTSAYFTLSNRSSSPG
jgi:hypothetical protein